MPSNAVTCALAMPPPVHPAYRGVSHEVLGEEGSWQKEGWVGCGKRLPFPAARPRKHPSTCEHGKGPGQGQGNTHFLSCSPQFLRASLEPIEDKAWTLGLSQELSQQLGSSAAGSWEKVCLLPRAGARAGAGALPTQAVFTASPSLAPERRFPPGCRSGWLQPGTAAGLACSRGWPGPSGASPLLTGRAVTASRARPLLFQFFLYKALGTALAACQDLRHIQGQVLRFLQETNPVELSEAQVRCCSRPEHPLPVPRGEGGLLLALLQTSLISPLLPFPPCCNILPGRCRWPRLSAWAGTDSPFLCGCRE